METLMQKINGHRLRRFGHVKIDQRGNESISIGYEKARNGRQRKRWIVRSHGGRTSKTVIAICQRQQEEDVSEIRLRQPHCRQPIPLNIDGLKMKDLLLIESRGSRRYLIVWMAYTAS